MLGADLGELLPGVGRDPGVDEELVEVLAVRLPGVDRWSPEQPGRDSLGHLIAQVAGDRPSGEGRNRFFAEEHRLPGSAPQPGRACPPPSFSSDNPLYTNCHLVAQSRKRT